MMQKTLVKSTKLCTLILLLLCFQSLSFGQKNEVRKYNRVFNGHLIEFEIDVNDKGSIKLKAYEISGDSGNRQNSAERKINGDITKNVYAWHVSSMFSKLINGPTKAVAEETIPKENEREQEQVVEDPMQADTSKVASQNDSTPKVKEPEGFQNMEAEQPTVSEEDGTESMANLNSNQDNSSKDEGQNENNSCWKDSAEFKSFIDITYEEIMDLHGHLADEKNFLFNNCLSEGQLNTIESLKLQIEDLYLAKQKLKDQRKAYLFKKMQDKDVADLEKKLANKDSIYDFRYNSHINRYFRQKRKVVSREITKVLSKQCYQVFLSGNSLLTAGVEERESLEATTGLGIRAKYGNLADFYANFTFTESNDTISSNGVAEFGRALNSPGVRKFSFYSSYRFYSIFPASGSRFWQKIGWGMDFNMTRFNWEKTGSFEQNDQFIDTTLNRRVVTLAANFMFPYTWIRVDKPDHDFKVSTEIGIAARLLGGELINDREREFYLNNGSSMYFGPIVGFNVQYNGLRINYTLPMLVTNSGAVRGLSTGQAIGGISFTGDFVKVFDSGKRR